MRIRGIFVLLPVLLFALLFARAMTRRFDLDEHQFVAPAILLSEEGLWPYRDYPYFHVPNLVLIYAGVLSLSPYKLIAARAVATLCGTAIVTMLFAWGWRRLRRLPDDVRWLFVGGLTATFLCSRMFLYTQGWAWNHEPATACALAGVLLALKAIESRRIIGLLAAGFLVGNAACIRLSFAPLVLPLALVLVCGPSELSWGQRWRGLLLAVVGSLVSAVPSLILLGLYREQFLFGNLGYADLSTSAYAAADAPAMTPLDKFLYLLRCSLSDPGNAVILASFVAAVGTIIAWRKTARPLQATEAPQPNRWPARVLLLSLIPFLWIGATAPTPAQYQYYFMLVPFALLIVFDVLASLEPGSEALVRWQKALRWGVAVTVLIGLPRGYWRIIDVPFPHRWPPLAVHTTGEWIAAETRPGDRILTIDPLPALEAGRHVTPQYAVGRFPMIVGPFTSEPQRLKQNFLWGRQLNDYLCRETPRAVLCDTRTLDLVPWFADYATDLGFEKKTSPDGQHVLWVHSRMEQAAGETTTRQ